NPRVIPGHALASAEDTRGLGRPSANYVAARTQGGKQIVSNVPSVGIGKLWVSTANRHLGTGGGVTKDGTRYGARWASLEADFILRNSAPHAFPWRPVIPPWGLEPRSSPSMHPRRSEQ